VKGLSIVRTLKDIINYDTAPLVQWEPAVGGEAPSEGKAHEDALTHAAIVAALIRRNARAITSIAADHRAGRSLGVTRGIADRPLGDSPAAQAPAFLLNVCTKRGPGH
jgi:hypothetical protein